MGQADEKHDEQCAETHDGVNSEIAGPMTFDSFEFEIALWAAGEHREPVAEKMTLPANSAVLHATA